jgi:hypothetical protein
MACIPGEVYPEIDNGSLVRAPSGGYDIEPLELPPLARTHARFLKVEEL